MKIVPQKSMVLDAPIKLVLNGDHILMKSLVRGIENNVDGAVDVAQQIFDNARMAAGILDDPSSMIPRINGFLERRVREFEIKN
jgi:TNF receptor-associated protein 1